VRKGLCRALTPNGFCVCAPLAGRPHRPYFAAAVGTFELVIGVGVACAVSFQAWLTHKVFRSTLYERRQKLLQAQLIWLLPIAGAVLVFSVLREDDASQRKADAQLRG
jgi:hypothetical protein